jgi:hypothetical protein
MNDSFFVSGRWAEVRIRKSGVRIQKRRAEAVLDSEFVAVSSPQVTERIDY